MNISEPELEKILLVAPSPKPPAGLKELLIAEAPSSARGRPEPAFRPQATQGWFRRWWPAFATAMVSLACVVVLAVQQNELRELSHSLQLLSARPGPTEHVQAAGEIATPQQPSPDLASAGEQTEIERLKQLAAQLSSEVAQLEQLRAENEKLRARLATAGISGLSREEIEAVEKAPEKALSIACINNLKQFGLAVRVWALDENLAQPPNVLCMSNELSTPKILVCPAESSRQAAANWSTFTPANCSYEYLVTSGTNVADIEPTRVLARCPIHGHIGLCDGSVQGRIAKEHPDWLVNRNGKLYFEPPAGNAPGP
jgi:hypothetical protein